MNLEALSSETSSFEFIDQYLANQVLAETMEQFLTFRSLL